ALFLSIVIFLSVPVVLLFILLFLIVFLVFVAFFFLFFEELPFQQRLGFLFPDAVAVALTPGAKDRQGARRRAYLPIDLILLDLAGQDGPAFIPARDAPLDGKARATRPQRNQADQKKAGS